MWNNVSKEIIWELYQHLSPHILTFNFAKSKLHCLRITMYLFKSSQSLYPVATHQGACRLK